MSQESICAKCGRPGSFSCQRCLECYCSSECQIRDWREHKSFCFEMPRLVPIKRVSDSYSTDCSKNASLKKREPGNSKYVAIKNVETKDVVGNSGLKDSKHITLHPVQDAERSTPKVRSVSPKETWKSPQLPPMNTFVDVVIHFIEESDAFMLWVSETKNKKLLTNLHLNIKSNVKDNCVCTTKDIYVGAVVAVCMEDTYYRAEVRSIEKNSSARVRLIDYGNEIVQPIAKLHPSTDIPIMINMPAYVFRARASKKFFPMDLETVINVRLTGSNTDAVGSYFNIDVRPKTVPLYLSVELLNKCPKVNVAKSFHDSVYALLRLSDDTSHEKKNMNTYLHTEQGKQFDFDTVPPTTSFVAALVDKVWYRACILGHWPKGYLVYLIDQGSMCVCEHIKKIPQAFVSQPMRVLLIKTIVTFDTVKLNEKQELSLELLSESSPRGNQPTYLACGLYAGDSKIYDVLASSFCGFVDELKGVQFWTENIADYSTVYITKILTHVHIFISLSSTKDYPEIFAAVADQCEPYPLDQKIEIGDIVLVKLDGNAIYFRGKIISNIMPNLFKVENIDTADQHELTRNHFRKASRVLLALPVYLQKVSLLCLENIKYDIEDNKAVAMLKECVKRKTNFKVSFDDTKINSVDLLFGDDEKTSLVKKLIPMIFEKKSDHTLKVAIANEVPEQISMPLTPPPTPRIVSLPESMTALKISSITQLQAAKPKSAATTATGLLPFKEENLACAKFRCLSDLEVIPMPEGKESEIYVLDVNSFDNGAIVAAAPLKAVLDSQKMLKQISLYCKSTNPIKGFRPRFNELCLAVYPVDREWYRAVCIGKSLDNGESFMVMFIDYGNISRVSSSNIIPMPADLMFPIIRKTCLVKNISKNQYEKFCEAVTKTALIVCDVTKVEGKKYDFTLDVYDMERILSDY